MAGIRIVLLCIVAAVVYGVLHDQVTARISIEYFTVGHPRLFPGDDPTLHGLVWGIIATWWVGLLLHLVEPFASRVPKGRHEAFFIAGGAHMASYASGFLGGIVLCIRTWRRRRIDIASSSK